jgi:DNA-directed RNA polymerase II subunit RPB4
MDDQQDSARLELGSVWSNAQCLNICEVEQLLKTPYLHGEASGQSKPHMEMAFKHARRFGKLKDSQTLHELRMALDDWEAPSGAVSGQIDARLASFEQAQLVNLTPNDPDEAVALIPSLCRFSAVDIATVLDIIASFMKGSMTVQS